MPCVPMGFLSGEIVKKDNELEYLLPRGVQLKINNVVPLQNGKWYAVLEVVKW